MYFIKILSFVLFIPLLAQGQTNELLSHNQNLPNKDGYSIFNPTPRKYMREFSTDRPDVTESAYSVDAGHFQTEMDVLKLTRSKLGTTHQNEIGIVYGNYKIGLTNRSDLQVVVESYVLRNTLSEKSVNESSSGMGDVFLRYKYNLWGNDKGRTALAAMPYVKLPVNSVIGNGSFEGGIIFPFAMQLPYEWTFGAQAEYDICKNAVNAKFHHEFLNTITVGRDIYKTLGGFIELASYMNTENYIWAGTFNGGLTFRPVHDIQLDMGVNLALTPESDNIYFLGLSFRY